MPQRQILTKMASESHEKLIHILFDYFIKRLLSFLIRPTRLQLKGVSFRYQDQLNYLDALSVR